MKIYIIHHHLKKGGVTTVIRQQVKSLINTGTSKNKIEILCGHASFDISVSGVKISVLEDLDYLYRKEADQIILTEKLNKLLASIKNKVTKNDVLHIHNSGLGKNPLLTMAVSILTSDGYHILNHCHDFPEDRPENLSYLKWAIEDIFKKNMSAVLYPIKDNLMYGVINRPDKERLLDIGIPEYQIYFLPDPIDPAEFRTTANRKNECRELIFTSLKIDKAKKLAVYPVRALERKNIKEIVLLSVLFGNNIHFAITLAPENPSEIGQYQFWKIFSINHGLPITFEAGEKVDFRELMAGTDFCITTSILEGFGLTFIEPWLAGTPVGGRDLPGITDDFKRNGIVFSNLYKLIIIRSMQNIDFKDLDRDSAASFIENLIQSKDIRLEIINDNPDLETLFTEQKLEIVESNRKIISDMYSLDSYGKRLNDVYKRLFFKTKTT